MATKEKIDRFQRIALERKGHVLETLQALGCCSDPASYAYETEALHPIFRDIIEKLAEVWHRLNCRSPYPFIPFRLGKSKELEIGAHRCRFADMVSMAEVLNLLRENGATFTALEPVRNRYADQFGNELCWSFPFSTGDFLGCVLLPVQEGVLYLPYTSLDSETYEQIDVEATCLLTEEIAQELKDSLLTHSAELYNVLADACLSLQLPTNSTTRTGNTESAKVEQRR